MPIAAIEQHGPHLPVGTDTIINTGHCLAVAAAAPAGLDIRFLPVQATGKSNEHLWAKGTLTHEVTTLIDSWVALGLSVARAGVRKLVMVNSHGGNEEIMGIVARELRVRANMLAVKTSWTRFGYPDGLIGEVERRHGIHGGEVETSLVLHFRPDLVDMSKADNFISIAARDKAEYAYLRPRACTPIRGPPATSIRAGLSAMPPPARPKRASASPTTKRLHFWLCSQKPGVFLCPEATDRPDRPNPGLSAGAFCPYTRQQIHLPIKPTKAFDAEFRLYMFCFVTS